MNSAIQAQYPYFAPFVRYLSSYATKMDRSLVRARWRCFGCTTSWAEQARGCLQQVRLPRGNLVRMNIKLLGQLGQSLFALDGRQCHLGLECWRVGPACSLRHTCS